MSEITKDFIRGVLAGRDYEREINFKETECRHTRSESKPYCVVCDPVGQWLQRHTDKVHDGAITKVIKLLEHKIEIINDIQPKMSTNGKILLDYQRKIVHSLIKEITEELT